MRVATYDEIRPELATGGLLEFCAHGELGTAIRAFTHQDVNHSAMIVRVDDFSADPAHQVFILEADTKIRLVPASFDLDAFNGEVYYSPLLPQFDYCRNNIAAWAMDQLGLDYDYPSLFKNMFGTVYADSGRMFCSELVFIADVAGGVFAGKYSLINGKVWDAFGNEVKAPVPGTFGQYGIYGDRIGIVKSAAGLRARIDPVGKAETPQNTEPLAFDSTSRSGVLIFLYIGNLSINIVNL